jgi:hypothetical protein
MANHLTVNNKKQFTDVTTILNSPTNRSKLQNYIDEVVRTKTQILDKNEHIKSIKDVAVEELNIEPKMFAALVSLYFNNNFEQKRDELLKLEAAINALMQTSVSDGE